MRPRRFGKGDNGHRAIPQSPKPNNFAGARPDGNHRYDDFTDARVDTGRRIGRLFRIGHSHFHDYTFY